MKIRSLVMCAALAVASIVASGAEARARITAAVGEQLNRL